MSSVFKVNTEAARSPFELQSRRLAIVLAAGLAASLLLTPLAVRLGMEPRKAAVTLLRGAVLLALVFSRRAPLLEETGLGACARPLMAWWRGFAVGAATLALWVLVLHLIDRRFVDAIPIVDLLWRGLRYLPLAFGIGFLEDLLFFGFLYTVLGRRPLPCALLYAVTHFLAPDKDRVWSGSGFELGPETLQAMSEGLLRMADRPIEVAGLFLVGWVLVGLRRESRAIWLGMGVHGGWFWTRAVSRKIGEARIDDRTWLYGSDRFYDGLLGWIAILACGMILIGWSRRRALLRGEEEG